MQGFIAVGFGIAQPVPEPFRRRVVFVGDHGIDFPAFLLFFFGRQS
jgi:hypothetical protein